MKKMIPAAVFLILISFTFVACAQKKPDFVTWEDPNHMFKAEVPKGWTINAAIDHNNIAMGAFLIQGISPDNRSVITFAHNWSCYYEYMYGKYQPGTTTLESIVLPEIPDALPQLNIGHLMSTYRSSNTTNTISNPYNRMPIQTDHGTLGVSGITRDGIPVAGTLSAETMYVPVVGSPGYWCLRLFMGELSIEGTYDETNRQILQHFVSTFEPSEQFRQIWNEGMKNTAASMRQYSAQIDRMTRNYLAPRSKTNNQNSIFDDYAEMTRGGHYRTNPGTGDSHYVSNDYDYHWVEPNGTIHSNNTGTMPDGFVGLQQLVR